MHGHMNVKFVKGRPHSKMYYGMQAGAFKYLCYIQHRSGHGNKTSLNSCC